MTINTCTLQTKRNAMENILRSSYIHVLEIYICRDIKCTRKMIMNSIHVCISSGPRSEYFRCIKST